MGEHDIHARTAEHPEVTEISELSEGMLPAGAQADVPTPGRVRALCRRVRLAGGDPRTLGTLPGPPRMPEDVASRIDAALAAEALLNATAPETETFRGRSVPDDEAASHGAVSRETAPESPGNPVPRRLESRSRESPATPRAPQARAQEADHACSVGRPRPRRRRHDRALASRPPLSRPAQSTTGTQSS